MIYATFVFNLDIGQVLGFLVLDLILRGQQLVRQLNLLQLLL